MRCHPRRRRRRWPLFFVLLAAGGCTSDPGARKPDPAHAGHDHEAHEDEQSGHAPGGHEGHEHEGHDHEAEHEAGEEGQKHEGHDHEAEHEAGEEGQKHEGHEGHEHEASLSGGASCVVLDDLATSNLGIRTQEVELQVYYERIKVPGRIEVDPDLRASVSTPIKGRVTSLRAPPHATVASGAWLAELALVDPEVRDLQIRAVQTRADLLASETERDRTRAYLEALDETGGGVEEERARVAQDLQVSEARLQSLRSRLDAVLTALDLAGLHDDQLTALEEQGTVASRIHIHAPVLSGAPALEVSERAVHLGQTVAAGTTLYELVGLDPLLVVGEAYEGDLLAVRRAHREQLPVEVYFPGDERRVEDLRIRSVAGTRDSERRTTHFHVPLPNHRIATSEDQGNRYVDWEYRSGTRVQLLVATEEAGRKYVIPSCALIREGGRSRVYRKQGDEYEPVEVRVESMEGRQAVIPEDGGLAEGDRVVVEGALQIHVIEQEQAGEGAGGSSGGHHGHAHP